MAIDLRSINTFPHFHIFNADITMTEIQLPSEVKTISIGSESKTLKIGQNGCTDGGAAPSNFGFVPSGNYLSLKVGIGLQRASVFVAVKSGTGDVSIILEEA